MSFYYLPNAEIISGLSAHDGVYLYHLPLPTLAGSSHFGHVRTLVAEHYPLIPPEQQERIAVQVWTFFTEILPEDFVLVPASGQELCCFEITGAYHYFKDASGRTLHGYPAQFRKAIERKPFESLIARARDWSVCITIEDEMQQFAVKKAMKTGYKVTPFWFKVGAVILLLANLMLISIRIWGNYQGKL